MPRRTMARCIVGSSLGGLRSKRSITAELYATQPARLLAKPEDNGLARDIDGLVDSFGGLAYKNGRLLQPRSCQDLFNLG